MPTYRLQCTVLHKHQMELLFLLVSKGYEFDLPPREDLLSLSELPDGPSSRLETLHQELVSLRLSLCQDESQDVYQSDWLALCCRLDLVLFRVYLLILAVYTCTLLLLWAIWSFA